MRFRFKVFFFFQYLAMGFVGPYFALYLYERQFSGAEIGLILGAMPIIGLLFQPVWGYLSDVLQTRRFILALACLGSGITFAGLGLAGSFFWAFVFSVFFSIFRSPIQAIITAIILDYLDEELDQMQFARIRLWGSLAFAVSSLVFGSLFLARILNYFTWIGAGSYFLLAALAFILPEAIRQSMQHDRKEWRFILKDRVLLAFLLSSIFVGATMSIAMNYLSVFMQSLDASDWLIGISASLQALLEVPLLFITPILVRKFSIKTLLLAGVLVLPLRWLVYLLIGDPVWIVPTQLLHSMAVTSLYVVGALFIDQQVPQKWRATGQGLFGTAMHGLASTMGLFMAGWMLEWQGVRSIWALNIVLGLVGAGMLIFAFRSKTESNVSTPDDA